MENQGSSGKLKETAAWKKKTKINKTTDPRAIWEFWKQKRISEKNNIFRKIWEDIAWIKQELDATK